MEPDGAVMVRLNQGNQRIDQGDKSCPMSRTRRLFRSQLPCASFGRDHVIWTRLYIMEAVAGAADAEAAATRLLKNQEDIGNAIVSFYGAEAGAALTDLLKSHILIAVDLV